VLLVSTDFENAVNRPLAEWKGDDTSKSDGSILILKKKLILDNHYLFNQK